MSAKTSGRIVGSMLLLGFLAYGSGSLLIASVIGTSVALPDVVGSERTLTLGVLLTLLNCAVVITLGVAAYPVLKRHHPVTASAYLLTRGFEAALLALSGVLVLSLVPMAGELQGTGDEALTSMAKVAQETSVQAYWVAMIGLSLGSLLFCRALFRAHLVHRAIAGWGFAGYALLATGGVLELLGHGVGIVLGAPGGLFEATLGALLVVKGFPEVQPTEPARSRTTTSFTTSGDAGSPRPALASALPTT